MNGMKNVPCQSRHPFKRNHCNLHSNDRRRKRMSPAKYPTIAIIVFLAASQMCQAESIKLALDTGNAAHVVVPGQEDQVGIVLTNTADGKADVSIHVEVESFDGSTAEADAKMSVPAQGTSRWPLPMRLFGELGIKWMRFWVNEHGGNTEPHEAAFAYMHPAGPTSERCQGFLFGIAYGAGPDNHAERAAERSALCGVKIARGHPVWSRIQPKPGQWEWASCDAIVDSHAKHGIEVQFLLSGAPRWSWQHESEGVPNGRGLDRLLPENGRTLSR